MVLVRKALIVIFALVLAGCSVVLAVNVGLSGAPPSHILIYGVGGLSLVAYATRPWRVM